jgi:hypothetical protein
MVTAVPEPGTPADQLPALFHAVLVAPVQEVCATDADANNVKAARDHSIRPLEDFLETTIILISDCCTISR